MSRRGDGRNAAQRASTRGVVETEAVPTSVYWVGFVADADADGLGPHDVGMAGDLISNGRADLLLLHPGTPEVLDLPVSRIMRLRRPEDNGNAIERVSGQRPVLKSPVVFRWDALPEAKRYDVAVQVYAQGEARANGSGRVTSPRTPSPRPNGRSTCQRALPDSSTRFSLRAFGDRDEIGELQLQGSRLVRPHLSVRRRSHTPLNGLPR